MAKIKSPCKGCTDRALGSASCHSVCEKYKAYRKALDEENKRCRAAEAIERYKGRIRSRTNAIHKGKGH